ncbi:MAG: hypothetical protein JSV52_04090 [Candidatus Zixiibacteriota bacterium]|nr:MAG: hypothetical protein JSV52_04090 [candidate division Zixibacteria bacterium]
MNVFVRLSILAMTLALVLAVGCSDRGPNGGTDLAIEQGGPLVMTHVFFNELLLQIKNDFQMLEMIAYRPKVNFEPYAGGELRPVPLLILLPPKGKDHYYYFNHGLQEIADELIATGQIQPMFIACISNDLVFGGYFFAEDHPGAGNYDTLVGQNLVDHIESFGLTIAEPAKRGIGGVGMGAYGAFRAAMLNPGTFTSISAVDGPLDFDGPDGNSGLIDLFVPSLTEQGLLGEENWKADYDSASAWPTTRLLIGGALAFSPHDTALECFVSPTPTGIIVDITERYTIDDTMTLVTNVVTADAYNLDFHLPFDGAGDPYPPIWNAFWLPNNLENLNTSALDDVNIFIATSDEASFGYHDQTMSWASTIQNLGRSDTLLTVHEYEGYPGNPATGDQYLYDLLKEMLIFHSNSFGNGD